VLLQQLIGGLVTDLWSPSF